MINRIVAVFVMVIVLLPVSNVIASDTLQSAKPLPDITLIVPENEAYRKYLGLSGKPGEQFGIADIKADILLIELFSMYCPYCQAEAPLVNDFHDIAMELKNKGIIIKVLGLGASNTQFEVDHFRDTYGVQFPLLPDKNLALYKALEGEGTPSFIGVTLKDGNVPQIVLKEAGGFDSAEEFLEVLLKKAGY